MSEKVDVGRKVDPRSVLKFLKFEKQKILYDFLEGGDGVKGHTYEETIGWLKETMGLEDVLASQLQDFRKWYSAGLKVEEKLDRCFASAKEVVEIGKRQGWIETVEEERKITQAFFNRFVLNEQDPKLWAIVEKVSLARDQMDIEKQKLNMEVEEHQAARKAKQPEEKPKLTPDEKRRRFKEIMGIA
jgi:hypothetical protein